MFESGFEDGGWGSGMISSKKANELEMNEGDGGENVQSPLCETVLWHGILTLSCDVSERPMLKPPFSLQNPSSPDRFGCLSVNTIITCRIILKSRPPSRNI